MIPFGEFAPDIADLNTNVASVADNTVPGANSYLPLRDLSVYSDALTNVCRGAITMEDNDGNNYIFAGDKTKLYSISGTTVTDESKVGGYTDNDENWSFVKFNEKVIAAKFADATQVLALGSSTFADLAGTPPQARTLAVVRNFVVAGNTYDAVDGNRPSRVRWSGFEDETEWTSGTNQSDFQDLEGDGGRITRIMSGEYGIIFQEKSIWRMSYVGEPIIFQFDEFEPGNGTRAGKSVVARGTDLYYIGRDGFYVLKNGTESLPIGSNKVDRWFYENVNTTYINRTYGALDPRNGVIVWGFPSTESPDGTPDRLIIYNFKSQKWSTATIATQLMLEGATSALTLEQLDSFGTLDTLPSSLDSDQWTGGTFQLAAFNSDNKLCFFQGSILSANLETGEFTEGYITNIDNVRPHIDGDCTVKIKHRDLLTETPTETITTSLDTSGKADFRVNARYNRVEVTTTSDYTDAIGVDIDGTKTGNR